MIRVAAAAACVLVAATIVQNINQRPEAPWLVETTPRHKGHSPNVPNAVVCVEQVFEEGINVGREKVVPVDDVGLYNPGDPCPAG